MRVPPRITDLNTRTDHGATVSKRWELSASSFTALLAALHSDRSVAGQEYERLRRRLIQFFIIHGAHRAEEIADEALNRLAKRISQGEAIQNIDQYLAGIGRMLLLEERQRGKRELAIVQQQSTVAMQSSNEEEMLQALESCLTQLASDHQQLLKRYYSAESRARIRERERMAAEMGISVNSLRNRTLRLREKLEACVRKHIGVTTTRDIRAAGDSTIRENENL